MTEPEKPAGPFGLTGSKNARELLREVSAGVLTAAILGLVSRVGVVANPTFRAALLPIEAMPLWLLLPTIIFAVIGIVSVFQKIGAARQTRTPGAIHTVEAADTKWLEVDLRSTGGVLLIKNTMTPQFRVYLRLTNLGPHDLRVTHLTIEVWFGQPTLKLMLDRPFTIPAYSSKNDVGLSDMPDAEKVTRILQFIASEDLGKTLYLYVSITCESVGGPLEKLISIERREPELSAIIR